jgi:hypothetical protein
VDAIPGVAVLDVPFYPKPDETRWSDLGNQTIQFGGCRELALTSILVSAFSSKTLSCSAATFSGPFSTSGFTSSLVEVSLLGPGYPWLLPDSSIEDPSFGTPHLC